MLAEAIVWQVYDEALHPDRGRPRSEFVEIVLSSYVLHTDQHWHVVSAEIDLTDGSLSNELRTDSAEVDAAAFIVSQHRVVLAALDSFPVTPLSRQPLPPEHMARLSEKSFEAVWNNPDEDDAWRDL